MNEDELYKTLIEKGVTQTHIEQMEKTPNQSSDPYERYYDYTEKSEYEHVPLSKIKGLGFRGTPGLSWFHHACYKGTDNIDVYRCQRAYNFLKGQSLEKFHEYYQSSAVKLKYFKDDDFYIVGGDGTHRTLYAKITGASHIYADVIYYEKDRSAFEAYRLFLDMESTLNQYLSSNDLKIESDRYLSSVCYKGKLLFSHSIYAPDTFIYKSNLKMEILEEWLAQQENLKDDILQIQKYRNKFHLIKRFTPSKWHSKIISFLKFWISTVSSTDLNKNKLYELREYGFRMFCIDMNIPYY